MPTLTRGSFARGGTSLDFRTGDWRVARPIHSHRIAPCYGACPAGEDPQSYLALVAQEDLQKAWETLVGANPLPAITGRVCHHPCESACNRGQFDESIAIHGVERSLGDTAIERGWQYPVRRPEVGAPEVAVVGAGPAGLAAAYHLLRGGYSVSLFEAQPEAGGLLRSALPPYRLPREVLNAELERLLATGIRFMPNQKLGRDFSLEELKRTFRAAFLAPGNGAGRPWSVDGVTPRDQRTGLALLKEWISIGSIPSYTSVAIVGGGNTAIDLARVLKFLGVRQVHVITFQALPGPAIAAEDAMSATPREIAQALEEGVTIHDHRGVRRIILRGEQVVGVEMVHMKEIVHPDGQRKAVAFEGTEVVLHVDQVVPAIGQQVDPFGIAELLDGHPFFRSDSSGQVPNHPGIFVGGDARGDRGTVSAAVGDGRRAAQAIDAYLKGFELSSPMTEAIAYKRLNVNYFDHAPRAQTPTLAPGSRDAETEIELGLTPGQVSAESHRCFSCGECMACDNCWTLCPDNAVLKTREAASDGSHYVFDYDHCKGCGLCAQECPVGFIAMTEEP